MDMAMVYPGLVRSSSDMCASTASQSSAPVCSDYRLQLRRTSLIMTLGIRGKSLGRQSKHGTICRVSGKGHTRLSHKERSTFEGWLSERHRYKHKEDHRSIVVAGAVPTGVTAVATLVAVAGSLYALLQLNKDKLQAWQNRKECDMCSGSGLCPTCEGEGFTMKNLSPEAAAKARAKARDAATRYTAGLAKKWNYCQTCQGVRLCPNCQGRGWICMVTMTLLRLLLCICSRARRKERMRRRAKVIRQGTDEEQACGSMTNPEKSGSTVAQAKRKLMLRPFLTIKKQILFAAAVPNPFHLKKFGPVVGNLTSCQALVDHKTRQVWQDKRFHQLIRRWLLSMWRCRTFRQQEGKNPNRLQTVTSDQVMQSQIVPGRNDFCEPAEGEITAPTIAWADPAESYDFETPSCSYRQEEKSIKSSQGFQALERTLNSLLDDFLAKDEAGTCSSQECLAYFCDTYPCSSQLPSQTAGFELSSRAASPLPPPPPVLLPMSADVELSCQRLIVKMSINVAEPAGE